MRFNGIIYKYIIDKTHASDNLMFFIKLCADIYRYMAENSEPNETYKFTPEGNDHSVDNDKLKQKIKQNPNQNFFIE